MILSVPIINSPTSFTNSNILVNKFQSGLVKSINTSTSFSISFFKPPKTPSIASSTFSSAHSLASSTFSLVKFFALFNISIPPLATLFTGPKCS